MLNKPSILPAGTAPGSHSLYDDFVYVHMNQTLFIHLTGNFFIWHRYFIHIYERELRTCGYNGKLCVDTIRIPAGTDRHTQAIFPTGNGVMM